MLQLLLVLALPFIVVRAVFQKLFGQLPSKWSIPFAVAVAIVRFLVARITAPLLDGQKLNLPSQRLLGRLARDTVVNPVSLAGLEAEWLVPKGRSPKRCILYLHGGAFMTGSIGTHRRLMAAIAHAADARVVGINYRLAPEHRFPAGLDDCLAAYKALLENGEDPAHLAIAGDSAGGGLTASTLLALKERGLPLPAAAWLLSPAIDLADEEFVASSETRLDYLSPIAARVRDLVLAYVGPDGDPKSAFVSPMHGELAGLPPMLIHIGGYELLLKQTRAFAEKAKRSGVDVTLVEGEQMVHVYPAFAGLVPDAQEAIEQGGEFLKKYT